MYAKDLNETNHEFLIKKREDTGIKHFSDPNAYIECSNTMDDVYENIGDYKPRRKKKLIVLMKWLLTLWEIKNFKAYSKNNLLDEEN